MKYLLLIPCMWLHATFAQDFSDFNKQRNNLDKKLMLSLGSWSVLNFVNSGIVLSHTPEAEGRYFHQMNLMWNAVNLSLAIPGYLKAIKKPASALNSTETIQAQSKVEKIFLFNTALDLVYMSAGLVLKSEAKSNVEQQDRFTGFGNGLLIQGGFLCLFDLTAYALHNAHKNAKLWPILEHVSLSPNGFGVQWTLGDQHSK